jgi:small subunit ribosomal protein S4
MIIGPKYKIARRLGAPVFEKTQTQKFSVRSERKMKNRGFSKQKSEFGQQLNEKQKARMYYGVSEKQFSKYVKEAISKKASKAVGLLFETLETRLDNIVCKAGFAPTHRSARQMVSHGHITVNGKKVTIPSMKISNKDTISIRENSKPLKIFADLEERFKNVMVPDYLTVDIKNKTVKISGVPKVPDNSMFDLGAVIGFYSR